MKRAGILLLLLAFLLTGCAAADRTPQTEIPEIVFPAREGFRVAVASDLHFNPDDTNKGEEATAVQYNMELAGFRIETG